MESTTDLWLNQPKAQYNWNVTSLLNWNAVSTFVQVAVSPVGEIFGIQTYNNGQTTVQYGYKFNFITGQWAIIDSNFQPIDIKFDKLGNAFFIDIGGNVYSNQNKGLVLLSGVKDFEVTTAK
jgi:hypothetical protein